MAQKEFQYNEQSQKIDKNESHSVSSLDSKKMFSDVCKGFVTGKWRIEVDSSFDTTSMQLLHET